MRIAVSGTGGQGKTTFIQDFLKQWPSYSTPEKTYRDILKELSGSHSKNSTKDIQEKIFEYMIETGKKAGRKDHVIYDRCTLDNLIYSLWSCEKGDSDIDEDFISKCIKRLPDAMSNLDIIFFIPMDENNPVDIVDDNFRETDEIYIKEIDYIFKAFQEEWVSKEKSPFYHSDDKPPWIELTGTREQRIDTAKLYVDEKGAAYGEESTIITEEMINNLVSANKDQPGYADVAKLLNDQKNKL